DFSVCKRARTAAAGRKAPTRRLWSTDSGGRFRTPRRNRGPHVRGTAWVTTETCAGTRTTVTQGAVSVRDLHRRKTVLVRAGGSYLAVCRRPIAPSGGSVRRMEMRQLGRTGVSVSPLCLGAMMFGAIGNPDHDDSIRIIHRALDAGVNFVDTADVYSRGESEEIVGKALAGRRDR